MLTPTLEEQFMNAYALNLQLSMSARLQVLVRSLDIDDVWKIIL